MVTYEKCAFCGRVCLRDDLQTVRQDHLVFHVECTRSPHYKTRQIFPLPKIEVGEVKFTPPPYQTFNT